MTHLAGIPEKYKESADRLKQDYFRGPSGHNFTQKRADMIDDVIVSLYSCALSEKGLNINPEKDVAIVAIGGYGRRELCPLSDIDLMILHKVKNGPALARVTEGIYYPLWDLGLQVGHGTRTIKESLQTASANFDLLTSFLDARLITGSTMLFDKLQKRTIASIRSHGGKRFLQNILEENDRRHRQYGQAAFLLEPDLKEGEGGLRDIHALLWATKGLFGHNSFAGLADGGYLSDFDVETLEQAFEFLLLVRNHLHYLTELKNDRLFFEHQVEIAKSLGFEGKNGISGTERFMRLFYTHARAIEVISRDFWEQLKVDVLKPKSARAFDQEGMDKDGIVLRGGKLSMSEPAALGEQPGIEIRLFSRALKEGLPIDYKKLGPIREVLEKNSNSPVWTRQMKEDFLEILNSGEAALPTLEVMNYLGVISRYIPEWSPIRRLPQYDSYHLYTVDMHLFLTVAEIKKIGSGVYGRSGQVLKQLYEEIERKDLLLLAGFLHDIGKGFGKGHGERGAKIARDVCARMGLSAKESKIVSFLVGNHLLLADTALRRDLNDESVIIDIAETVFYEDRLKMLYLLSIADSLATGPKAWDTWKENLLRELFSKALHIIQGKEYTNKKSIERLRRTMSRVKAALSDRYSEEDVDAFLRQMPHSYLLAQSSTDVIGHFEQIRESGGKPSIRLKSKGGMHELVLVAKDQPGLFCKITGVLALHGINIMGAQVYTGRDGLALDVFNIVSYFENDRWEDKRDAIERDVERALGGEIALDYCVAEKAKRYESKRALGKPPRVEVDNSSSDFYTVIEVHAQDRIGLLYTITRVMYELNLDIHLAKVSTNVDKVIDVFYVWDVYGQKLFDEEQISDIKKAILSALE